MEQGAVRHRAREVGAEAAVDGHFQLQRQQAPAGVEASAVAVVEGMTFAGDAEIVVALQAQLDRAARFVRRQRGPHGQVPGLGFLAAKATPHAPAFHPHRVLLQPERVRHPVLHFAGMLGAAVDEPLVLLLRQRVGDLAFEVEVFLATGFERAVQAVRRLAQGSGGVAAAHDDRRQHEALRGQRLLHAQDGRQGLNVQAHGARGAARLVGAVRHHQPDDLPGVLHVVLREDWFVVGKGGQYRVAGNVGGEHDVDHPGKRQRGAGVDLPQPAVGHAGKDGRGVQRAAHFRDVVNVTRRARGVGGGALVRQGRAQGASRAVAGLLAHGVSGSRVCRSVAVPPWLSSQKRCSSWASTSCR